MLAVYRPYEDAAEWQRLGCVPGLSLRIYGMRRSGNHAIASWLQRNAPEGRTVFLNNCRRGANPLDGFSSIEVNGNKAMLNKARADLARFGRKAGDGAMLLVSYEDHSPAQNPETKPLSGSFDQSLLSREILIYRGALNWLASLTKKLETNRGYGIARRVAVILRSVDLYSGMLAEVIEDSGPLAICYDTWAQDETYRAGLLAELGLEVVDNGLGEITSYGGGSSFQKDATATEQLSTDQRWREMMGDPLYQIVLQAAARDAVLVERVAKLFPQDAEVLKKIAAHAPISEEVFK